MCIIIVCSDSITHALKGKTVMTDEERYEAVRHCRYVDEVLRNAPWEIDDTFLIDNKVKFYHLILNGIVYHFLKIYRLISLLMMIFLTSMKQVKIYIEVSKKKVCL